MPHLPSNIFWKSLTGPHTSISCGGASARRYAPGFSPIIAFLDPSAPDFSELESCCNPGERFYSGDWSGSAPAGWRIELESTMRGMIWDAASPDADEAPDALALGPQHVDLALELAELTRPGPFGPRTIEMGEYFGYIEDGVLVAMAGERMAAPGLREISGVCTRPGHQGRGLARKLMLKLVRRQLARGETPFLHVMSANERAHALYRRMGFRDEYETVVRVVSRI
jgi:ribosomal protein S18 acetylase RimI-like enzyme